MRLCCIEFVKRGPEAQRAVLARIGGVSKVLVDLHTVFVLPLGLAILEVVPSVPRGRNTQTSLSHLSDLPQAWHRPAGNGRPSNVHAPIFLAAVHRARPAHISRCPLLGASVSRCPPHGPRDWDAHLAAPVHAGRPHRLAVSVGPRYNARKP